MSNLDYLMIFLSNYLAYLVVVIFLIFVLREKSRRLLSEAILSIFLARGVLTELIRFFYHSPRPSLILNSWSFPSGHAAFFFALAMTTYFYNKKIALFLFISASLISFGRVYLQLHWSTDILGGLLIGIGSAFLIHKLLTRLNL